MLRLLTPFDRMNLLVLLILWAFTGMTSAENNCDPLTQYPEANKCCSKCPPGSSMASSGLCDSPVCNPCADGEYQDTHTKEHMCQLQPYCDQNKNFQPAVHTSKTERTICKCKRGFHCSSQDCLTCVPHSVCKPGLGAKHIGNNTHDTVCEKCPEGTFSSDTSWDGVCKQWTECKEGNEVQERGTDTSDNKCVEKRSHKIPIIVCSVIGILVAIPVLIVVLRAGCLRQKAKNLMAATHLTKVDKEGYFEPAKPRQEEKPQIEIKVPMTPEENEDEPTYEMSSEGLTERGNCVMQEMGKEDVLSRQESQQESGHESLITFNE